MPYLLDTNVLIQAKNYHYGFDFCPGFWSWIEMKTQAGVAFSVESVGNELIGKGDDLANWAAGMGDDFFLRPDGNVAAAMPVVSQTVSQMQLANGQKYTPAALATFLGSADYLLVCHGLAYGYTVVSHEVSNQASVKKVKIPDVCAAVAVNCMLPFEMLRIEGARLII